jgi:hypothetical protein
MAKTKGALKILDQITGEEELKRLIAEEARNVKVARMIYEAPTKAGVTQQLAKRAGTAQSVIARLGDADYRGYSLTTLRRIATAPNGRLETHLVAGRCQLKAA